MVIARTAFAVPAQGPVTEHSALWRNAHPQHQVQNTTVVGGATPPTMRGDMKSCRSSDAYVHMSHPRRLQHYYVGHQRPTFLRHEEQQKRYTTSVVLQEVCSAAHQRCLFCRRNWIWAGADCHCSIACTDGDLHSATAAALCRILQTTRASSRWQTFHEVSRVRAEFLPAGVLSLRSNA